MRGLTLGALSFVAAVAVLGGCNETSPRQGCEDLTIVLCARLYECTTEAERGLLGLPPTEAGCIVEAQVTYGCEALTSENVCSGAEVYQPAMADRCIQQIDAIECGQLRDGYDEETDTPACTDVCLAD